MRAHRLIVALALLRPPRAAAPARAARRRAAAPSRRRRSACRIWCGSTRISEPAVSPGRQARRLYRCAPRTWTPTRGAPPSGCSISASATPRRCGSPIWRPTRASPEWSARRALPLLPVEPQRLEPGVARRRRRRRAHCRSPTCRSMSAPSASRPKADRVLVSVEVYRDCADLACTKQRLDAAAHSRGARGALRQDLRAALGHVERRPPLAAVRDRARRLGPRERDAGQSDRRPRRRRAEQAVRRPRGLRDQSRTDSRWRSRCAPCRWANPGRPTSTSTSSPAARRNAAQFDRRQSGLGRPAGLLARRLDARLPRHGPARIRSRTAFIWCCSTCRAGDKRPLTQNWDRSIGSFAWSRDGKTLFATTDHLGQHPLWAIDAATGRASAITGDGDVEGFSVGPKKVFYTHSNLANPGRSLLGRIRRRQAARSSRI